MTDEPIPAATLIVVREAAAGAPQLLMVERAPGMAFAGGALVFPGGRIDEAVVSAVFSAPSQNASMSAFALCTSSIVESEAFQKMASGTFSSLN